MTADPRLGTGSTFVLRIKLGASREREEFLAWAWREFAERGLQGVHEGSVFEADLDGGAPERPEDWEIDFGLADPSRDWVGKAERTDADLYFATEGQARSAQFLTLGRYPDLSSEIVEQKSEDWNARWRDSFTGIDVPPYFKVVPPWREDAEHEGPQRVLRINPGAGFGTGSHETTRLCLETIGSMGSLEGKRVLDFGSGSGILAIASALAGATVDAAEIDTLANDNARENCAINGVAASVRIAVEMPDRPEEGYDLVVANILRPVLIEFAGQLVDRLASRGDLILSGLLETDLASVRRTYEELMRAKGRSESPEVGVEGEWRRLYWKGRR